MSKKQEFLALSQAEQKSRMKVALTSRKASVPPDSAMVVSAIVGKLISEPQEVIEEENITSTDYDDWIYQAFCDLIGGNPRIQATPAKPDTVECPRKRLLRIGREAEHEGKPSELFRYLMELTDNGTALPQVTERAMSVAQKYLNIAIAFKQFAAAFDHKGENFKDLKREFRRTRDDVRIHVSESTLERALRAHDLNWGAYAIEAPRKGKRNKHG